MGLSEDDDLIPSWIISIDLVYKIELSFSFKKMSYQINFHMDLVHMNLVINNDFAHQKHQRNNRSQLRMWLIAQALGKLQ
jgi:hypothetical protein